MTTARRLCSAKLERDIVAGSAMNPGSPTRRLNALVTKFNPVAGTIIGMTRGRGKRENGPVDGFSARALHTNRR